MRKIFSISMMACFSVLISGSFQMASAACDAKCEKKVAKSVVKYEKAIVKTETKGCKEAPILTTAEKRCTRAMRTLDKRYDLFKDYIKQHADMQPLRKRHEQLHVVLENFRKQIENQDLTYAFHHSFSAMSQGCITSGSQGSCLEHAKIVKSEYASFPPEIQNSEAIKSKMAGLEGLLATNSQLANETKEKKANLKASNAASDLYYQSRTKIKDITRMLRMGRDNQADDTLSRLALITKLSSEIDVFKKNCEGSFKSVSPESSYAEKIEESCDLMANFDKYIAQYKNNSGKQYYQAELSRLSTYVSTLKETGKVYDGGFNTLMNDFDSYKKSLAEEASFIDVPMEKFDAIHDDFEDAVKIAIKNNDWEEWVGEEMHDDFEARAEGYAKRNNMELKKGWYAKNAAWLISKNGLGVPLYKYSKGYMLLEHDDESDYRMYEVTFYRDFDGVGYESATRVEYKSYVMPVED